MTDPVADQAQEALLAAIAANEEDSEDGAQDAAFMRWMMMEATPEDWHRFALGANWDTTEPALFQWIVSRPTCDKATALLLFWRAQPDFFVEHPEDTVNAEAGSLVTLIRDRWLADAYSQSAFSFFLKDELHADLDDLDRRFPDRAPALIPSGMRVNLFGRAVDEAGTLEGVPMRFWPEDFQGPVDDATRPDRLGRLNHVGVATPSIERAVESYHVLLGAHAIGTPFDLPAQGVRVCFVDAPNCQIELIEPLGETSPIAAFLRKNPAGGQHHLCFEAPDIDLAVQLLRHKGATILGEPRIGAHGTPVIFVHPKDMGGVLIELMETPKADAAH